MGSLCFCSCILFTGGGMGSLCFFFIVRLVCGMYASVYILVWFLFVCLSVTDCLVSRFLFWLLGL